MPRLWPIPVLADNYVWLLQTGAGRRVAVVDPGDGPAVLAALERERLVPGAVLLTHHHPDHVGGADELRGRHVIPVFGPASEAIPAVDRPLGDGDRVVVPDLELELEVVSVPGHTAGHIAYLGEGFVLSGDTLFAGGCGRLFEGTAEQMYRSLRRLAALDPATAVYCAHEYTVSNLGFAVLVEPDNGDLRRRLAAASALRAQRRPTIPSTVAEELATNPFLRCAVPSVRAAAERFAGTALGEEVAVFAAVRRWKDGWQG